MEKENWRKNITIRLNKEELGILENLAIKNDMNKGEYIRYLLLREHIKQTK